MPNFTVFKFEIKKSLRACMDFYILHIKMKRFLFAGYDTVCYGDLGCFVDGPPYGDTSERPTVNLPNDPSKIKTRFYLDTRSEQDREVFNTDMVDLS